MSKTAIVHTNDPEQPRITLRISGFVENFVTIQPPYVRLTGAAGQPIQVPVTIIPEEKYPFKILGARATSGTNIRYEIKERGGNGEKGYTLLIENLKQEKGRYHDTIRLQTDSAIQPEISIRIFGYIQDGKGGKTGS